MTSNARKRILWVSLTGLVILALGVGLWIQRFHRYTPVEAVLDLRAAAQARNAPRPVERFLELRYGPLTEATNRQKAFLDFFNVGHIEGLHLIVSRLGPEHQRQGINAMAQWIANYRRSMSPEERRALGAQIRSEAGSAAIHRATAKYLQHDVRYRAATAPVIQELMATVAAAQQ